MSQLGSNILNFIYDFTVVQEGKLALQSSIGCAEIIDIEKNISEVVEVVDISNDNIIAITRHIDGGDKKYIDIINI